jgi:tetrahydromethanopterin S-methyltransferase subunit G
VEHFLIGLAAGLVIGVLIVLAIKELEASALIKADFTLLHQRLDSLEAAVAREVHVIVREPAKPIEAKAEEIKLKQVGTAVEVKKVW